MAKKVTKPIQTMDNTPKRVIGTATLRDADGNIEKEFPVYESAAFINTTVLPTDAVNIALDPAVTLEEQLAAIDRWYANLLAQARIEYKARRKAVLEKRQNG